MANIKPTDIKHMSTEERVELAARFAMESYVSVIYKDNFLEKLAKNNPKEFANLVTQLLKLQLEQEKIKATNIQETNTQPTNINISFVSPESKPNE